MKNIFIPAKATVLATLIILFMVSIAQAATKTWVPTTGGSWTTAANWSPSGAPKASDDVVINSDQSAAITAVPTISLSSLTISGNCNLQSSAGTASYTTITVTGSFSLSASKTFTCGLNNTGRLNFTLSSTCTGTINGTVYMNSYSGSGYDRTFTNSGDLEISSNGLITGQNTSIFVLSSGATLKIANAAGITTSGSTGAIQVPGTRTYSTGANYVYNGTAAQVTGNGLTQNTPANITINNTAGVTLSANTNLSGTLTVNAGSTLALSNYTLGATTAPSATILYCAATTGSTISGSGTLTLGGNVTVNEVGSGSSGATISCPVALGATRTFTVNNERTTDADLTMSGAISGTSCGITKAGTGKMVLGGNNTYTGSTTISAGTLLISASERISSSSNMVLNGGAFSTGSSTGYSETVGTLALSDNSVISLGTGSHTLTFAASDGVSWTSGKTLLIYGWQGTWGGGTTGTDGKITFSSTSGLTTGQLAQILFIDPYGTAYTAMFRSGGGGEIIPNSETTYTPGSSSVVTTFTSSGTWTAPCGVTSVQVECWGGGGAGGSAVGGRTGTITYTYYYAAGGGGAGGAYAKNTSLVVTPGNGYAVTVGAAVTAYNGATDGQVVNGNPSWFNSTSTIYAEGGAGGVSRYRQTTNVFGNGGTGSSGNSLGNLLYAGGSGASGSVSNPYYGGGGGSSAGTGSNGNNGSGSTAGTAPAGGAAGGNGATTNNSAGVDGSAPGGGGGGALDQSRTQRNGGAGAAGQVRITYTPAMPGVKLDNIEAICQGITSASLPFSELTGCPAPNQYAINYASSSFTDVAWTNLPETSPLTLSVPAGLSTGSYTGSFRVRNSSTGQVSQSYTIQIDVTDNSWVGTSTDWATASNWCNNLVPDASTDVVIPAAAANKPQVNNGPSSPATCRNLTIESGATLTINAGCALTVEGTTTLNGSNCLIIKSVSAGETGSFISKGTVTGTGTAQIERYIDNSKSGWDWHMLSSPVTAQPIWPAILPAPNGSYYWGTGTLDWDFYYWNPNTPNAYPHTPWVNIRKADGYYNSGTFDDAGDAAGYGSPVPQMQPARGYLVGFNTNDPEVGVTKTFTGVPNTGTIYDHVANQEDLFNLTGNPYPSSIDWKSSSLSRSNLDYTSNVYTYWVWNEDAGTYGAATSSQDEGTNGVTHNISPMQAFWVQAKDKSASARDLIGFSNDARVHSGQKYLKSTASTGNSLRLKLTTSANTYSDEMIVSFDPSFPGTGGAEKMFSMYSESPEIYSWKNSKYFSIDMYPQVTDEFTVDLYTKNNVAGTYTITASNINDFVLSGLVILKNIATGEEYDLRQNPSYSFTIPANASPKAFQLIFRAPGYLNTLGTGSWNLPTTWLSNKVPAPTDNIIISHAVSVDNSPLATCNNLVMNSGGTLTVESGQALTVNGTLTSNSTSNVLVKSGGSLINNSPGVKATVKRDITGTVYHFVSAPVIRPALGSVFPLTTYVQQYDEPGQKWVNLKAADPMETGKGYSAYLEGSSAVECAFAGELNSGDVTISGLTKTGTANDDYNGWNLLGNPFTSAIDAASIGGWGLTNVDPFVYVWNGGNYLCHSVTIPGYASNTTGTMATPFVPAQQGFFVHVTDQTPPAATGSVTIPFTARVHSNQGYYKGTNGLPNCLNLEVAGNGYSDKAMVYFTGEATTGYDVNYDAYKLSGLAEAPQLYSILPGRKLAINALQTPQTSDEVPLGFVAGAETSYTLTFTGMESFDASIPLRLDDLKTGLSRDLRTDPVYGFTAAPGDDEHRFRLRFKSATGFGEQESTKQVYIYTLGKDVYISANQLTIGTCEVYIYDAVGQRVYQGRYVPAADNQRVTRLVTPGAYVVRVISGTGTTTEKIIIP